MNVKRKKRGGVSIEIGRWAIWMKLGRYRTGFHIKRSFYGYWGSFGLPFMVCTFIQRMKRPEAA